MADATTIAQTVVGGTGAAANALMNPAGMLTSVFGFLPHAMIFVPQVHSNAAADALDGLTGGTLNNDVMALRALTKAKKKKSKGVMGGIKDHFAKQVTSFSEFITLSTELGTRGWVAMEVQYNPSTINFTNTAGKIRNYSNAGDLALGRSEVYDPGLQTLMSVQLVFDAVNLQDAFRAEGMNLTIGNAVETVGNIYNNVKNDGYSVQKPVEGLLSILQFKRTRQIIFYWAEMFFHGELRSVNVNYTMFNKLGHPIRATVDLSIIQSDNKDAFASDAKAWNEALTACFGEPGMGKLISA